MNRMPCARVTARWILWTAALGVAACARPAAGQRVAPATSTAAPLADFTVTFRTRAGGMPPGPRSDLSLQSDGTARLEASRGGASPSVRSGVVHLPARALTRLAQALADPAFAHLPSSGSSGPGLTTLLDVRAPQLTVHYSFYEPDPPAAEPVLNALAGLRQQVVRLVLADQSANGACVADADCVPVPSECDCLAVPRATNAFDGPPGHCVAPACGRNVIARCDPAAHRCVLSTATATATPTAPGGEVCPSGIPEVVSPRCAAGAVCGGVPAGGVWRGRCVAPGTDTARCDGTTLPCNPGLACDEVTRGRSYCRHPGALGASCGVAVNAPCNSGLRCGMMPALAATVCMP